MSAPRADKRILGALARPRSPLPIDRGQTPHPGMDLADGRDRLDPEQVRMRQGLIKRRGRPCGLFFQIQGPRLLRTYAVWAADEFRILFYDSTGERFGEARLSEAPDATSLSGHAAQISV
jgi:hypothetical protein